jgi:putative lipoprotein
MFRLAIAALFLAGCTLAPAEPTGAVAAQPQPAIEGAEWRAVEIDGAAVAGPGPRSLTLRMASGRAGGGAGCNNYAGDYALAAGQGIRFGSLGGTRMLCHDQVMALERRFFSALAAARRYTIAADGSLLLSGENGRSIRVVRDER